MEKTSYLVVLGIVIVSAQLKVSGVDMNSRLQAVEQEFAATKKQAVRIHTHRNNCIKLVTQALTSVNLQPGKIPTAKEAQKRFALLAQAVQICFKDNQKDLVEAPQALPDAMSLVEQYVTRVPFLLQQREQYFQGHYCR